MKKLIRICFLCLLTLYFAGIVESAPPKGQTVTYSDFNYIRGIASSNSHVYFLTTNGITVYNKFSHEWEDPLTGKYGIDDQDIRRIWVDHFGDNIYAQTSTDLFQYDSLAGQWYQISGLPVMISDDEKVDPPKVMFPPFGYNYMNDGRLVDRMGRYFSFAEMIKDGQGNYWIGTWGDGAGSSSSSGLIELLPNGLLQPRVNSIYNDEGTLWISGAALNAERTGVTIFRPYDKSFSYIESGLSRDFPSVDVNCIAGDSSTIYLGTEYGVLYVDRDSRQILKKVNRKYGLTNDDVLSLATSGDSIFVGTAEGLNMVLPLKDSLGIGGPTQLLHDVIYDLEVVDTTLWIASSSGAYRWYWTTDKLQQYQDPHLVIFSKCLAIARWKNFLWLASSDGLVKLNLETGETTPFRSVMSNQNYRALAVNDTVAAISSNHGMTILFHANEKPFEREFTTDDGLPSSYVFDLVLDGDYIWIGTDKGLTRFLWNNPSRVD